MTEGGSVTDKINRLPRSRKRTDDDDLAERGHSAALWQLRKHHSTLANEHEGIAQEVALLVVQTNPDNPEAYAAACADLKAKRLGAALGRRRSAHVDDVSEGLGAYQRSGKGRSHGERFDDPGELRAAVLVHCRDKWRNLTGRDWTEADTERIRQAVYDECQAGHDIAAAAALYRAMQAAVARLDARGEGEPTVRKWIRQHVAPLMEDAAAIDYPKHIVRKCMIDERAALVRVLDGQLGLANFAGLGREAKPVELAWAYYLAGYWEPPSRAKFRAFKTVGGVKLQGISVAEAIRDETRRMADARKRHGRPDIDDLNSRMVALLQSVPWESVQVRGPKN